MRLRAVTLFVVIVLPALCYCHAQTSGKPARARTGPEYEDYNKAYAISGGPAMENAANEFATKYPDSVLRAYLYSKAMRNYQNENNSGKMLAMGEKVLALEPHNVVALVLTAAVLSDNLSDNDADRTQKIEEIRANVSNAIKFVDEFTPPTNPTPEQLASYRNTLQSMAHSALGITDLKLGEDAEAEKELVAAAKLNAPLSDPYLWYHLALAQDHQKKYKEGLASVEEALKQVSSNPDLAKLAASERERLLKLTQAQVTK
jgi:tetratricopeptide (TPR) repeat protein